MISIVVPVRQPHDLAATIESLRAACVPHAIEIITREGDGVPQLRAAAALAANGDRIAIVQDHCLFPPGWLDALLAHDADVVGGPVANGRLTYAGWAQYFTRYAAFLRATHLLPGCNALYRREWLDRNRPLWRDGFWEAELNAALQAQGARFHLDPRAAVTQTQRRGAIAYIPLRFRHGRCYGARRPAADRPGLRSILIPGILFARVLRAVLARPEFLARFVPVAPLVFVYQLAWAAGEITGYLAGAGDSCRRTD